MSDAQAAAGVPARPAVAVRLFGWWVLSSLLAFLVNNYLQLAHDFPGVRAAFGLGQGAQGVDGGGLGWLQVAVYGALAVAVAFYVLSSKDKALRADGDLVSAFNRYLIRACFFGVLFVGLADAAISFLRVEDLLVHVVGEQATTELGRSQYRGPVVHVPLLIAGAVIALFTRTLGFHWLALLIVVAELAIVITRFVFSYEQAFMGDLVRFWYAALFLFASAYTLLEEGHVRVDVFYAGLKSRTKGAVNAVGSLLLGMTFAWVIIYVGLDGPAAIINSPMLNFEVSQSGFGMYTKYLMAGFLGVFAITMLVQFVSYFFQAVADLRGEEGARVHDELPVH